MHHLSSRRGNVERALTAEQSSASFFTSFGMRTGIRGSLTPRFNRTPLSGVSGLNCPPTGRGTNGAGDFEEGLAEFGGYKNSAFIEYTFTATGLYRVETEEENRNSLTPRFNRIPLSGVSGLNCPPTDRGTNGAGDFEEGLAEFGGTGYNFSIMEAELEYGHFSSSEEEYAAKLWEVVVSASSIPPHRCKRGTPLLNPLCQPVLNPYADISPKWGKQSGRINFMEGKFAPVGTGHTASLLTIKMDNSLRYRGQTTNKNAHLSWLIEMGTGDYKLFPFFLISKHALKCEKFSPLGEMSRFIGAGGNGLVANINKTSAYET